MAAVGRRRLLVGAVPPAAALAPAAAQAVDRAPRVAHAELAPREARAQRPAGPLSGHSEPVSYLYRQLVTTRNVTSSVLGDWFFGDLNYPIEHHLLPTCPRRHLARAKALIRPFCQAHGLPYHEQPYFSALRTITRHVMAIGRLKLGAPGTPEGDVADLSVRGTR